MNDYGLDNAYEPIISEQSDFAEPVAEQQQQQQQQQQADDARRQQYVIFVVDVAYTCYGPFCVWHTCTMDTSLAVVQRWRVQLCRFMSVIARGRHREVRLGLSKPN